MLLELCLLLVLVFSVGVFLIVRGILQGRPSPQELAVEEISGYSGDRIVGAPPPRQRQDLRDRVSDVFQPARLYVQLVVPLSGDVVTSRRFCSSY